MPEHDEHDDLAALDFSATDEPGFDDHGAAEADALDFSVAGDSAEESGVDALDEYAPAEPEDTENELETIHAVAGADEEEDEEAGPFFTVTNPPDTVSVSAAMDGSTQRVELSAKVTNMSESQLADEVLVLADLARQKGLAGQHTYLLENTFVSNLIQEMSPEDTPVDDEAIRDYVENFMGLTSPEQAAEAQAKVFATRYAQDHD